MLKAKIFYIFLFLIVVETIGLLLKRGLEMGYFGTEAIILAVFSFAFYNLCSFGWVYFTIKNNKKINRTNWRLTPPIFLYADPEFSFFHAKIAHFRC